MLFKWFEMIIFPITVIIIYDHTNVYVVYVSETFMC